jgi:hypothetical protein
MNWLDANADGLALLLIVGCIGLAWLLVAIAIEWACSRGMRRRRRRREQLQRYCDLVDQQATRLVERMNNAA